MAWLVLGGIAAISAGVKFASRLPERRMRLAFSGLLLLTAVLLAQRGSRLLQRWRCRAIAGKTRKSNLCATECVRRRMNLSVAIKRVLVVDLVVGRKAPEAA
jgi:hypothetical protein